MVLDSLLFRDEDHSMDPDVLMFRDDTDFMRLSGLLLRDQPDSKMLPGRDNSEPWMPPRAV